MLPSGSSVSFIIGSVHEKRRCHREQPPTTTFIKLIVIIVICTKGGKGGKSGKSGKGGKGRKGGKSGKGAGTY